MARASRIFAELQTRYTKDLNRAMLALDTTMLVFSATMLVFDATMLAPDATMLVFVATMLVSDATMLAPDATMLDRLHFCGTVFGRENSVGRDWFSIYTVLEDSNGS